MFTMDMFLCPSHSNLDGTSCLSGPNILSQGMRDAGLNSTATLISLLRIVFPMPCCFILGIPVQRAKHVVVAQC